MLICVDESALYTLNVRDSEKKKDAKCCAAAGELGLLIAFLFLLFFFTCS